MVITTAAYFRTYDANLANDRYVDCDNRVRRQVAAATGAPLIDLFARTCHGSVCPKYENGIKLRPDGLHYEGAGARADRDWLVTQLHAQARQTIPPPAR